MARPKQKNIHKEMQGSRYSPHKSKDVEKQEKTYIEITQTS
jgi:hypothetical protein